MMRIDRRTVIGSGLASMLPQSAFAQLADPSLSMPIDAGQWCSIPDFEAILDGISLAPTVVCGWRPERRVNRRPCVRLEATTTASGKTIIHNYGHCGSGITLGLGCASLAEHWLAASSIPKDSRITIVGAGIIGLAVAYVLKRRGYTRLRILAKALASGNFGSPATVSDIAGGQFDAAGIDDVTGNVVPGDTPDCRLRATLKETIDALTERRGQTNDPFLSHGFTDQYVYTVVRNYTVNPASIPPALEQANDIVTANSKLRAWILEHYGQWALDAPRAEGVIAPFRIMQQSRLEPVRFGVRNTILINTANLIANLKRYLASPSDGPRCDIVTGPAATIQSATELQDIEADVVFNCTGLGGAILGGADAGASMTGRYGLLAKLPRIRSSFGRGAPRYLYSGFGYMFPRSDGTVVGGAWDARAPWGLPEVNVDAITQQGVIAQERYFNSLLSPGDPDVQRANDMVRAIGYFFMGKSSELATMASRLDWFSNASNIDCASDRSQCR